MKLINITKPKDIVRPQNSLPPLAPKTRAGGTSSAPIPQKIQILIWSLGIICVGLFISNVIFIQKVHTLQNPGEAVVNETKQIVSEISRFIVLPTNETPTLATVSDPSKLRDQKFFANAMTGDKVLIYQNSQKAILWRPSTQKIIEISSLSAQVPTK